MSLGFNHNRKYRTQTLPGTVNPVVIRDRRSSLATSTTMGARRKSPPNVAIVLPNIVETPAATTAPLDIEEVHTVYATVAVPLVDSASGSVAATVGKRVVLVYPMTADPTDGRVTMRMKSVDARTAQLSYTTVTVYDPNTETHYATDFSLTP